MNTLGAKAFAPLPRRLTVALCGATLVALVLMDRQAALLGSVTGHPALVDAAATWDLTVGASLLCWWMLGRDFHWSARSLVPLFFASLALAGLALPQDHRGALRVAHLGAAPLELLTLAFLVRKVRVGRRSFRSDAGRAGAWDAQAALQRASADALGPGRFAEMMAYEMSVLYYALGARHAHAPEDGWTYHRRTAYGAIVFALLMATGVEVVAVHFLASLWSHRLAWALSGLGAYGALWIYGDWRACRLRPVTMDDGVLRVRFGLRWTLDIPTASVKVVRPPTSRESTDKRALDLRLALPGASFVVLELDRPVQAEGIYGLRRTIHTLGLGLDEPARLAAAMAEANPETESR